MQKTVPIAHPSSPPVRKPLLILLVACSLIVLLFGLYILYSYLEQKQYNRTIRYGVRSLTPNMVKAGNERREEFIRRLKTFRTQLEPWARKNQVLLKKIDTTSPQNVSLLYALHNRLPNSPGEAGLPPEMFGSNSLEDLGDPSKFIFSWEGFNPRNPGKEITPVRKHMVDLFRQKHDFVLTRSIASGEFEVHLWASGRITESHLVDATKPGEESTYAFTELVPPFDFLQRK